MSPRLTLHILPPALGLPTPDGPSLAALAYLVSAGGAPGTLWAVDSGLDSRAGLGLTDLPALHDARPGKTDAEGDGSKDEGKGTWVAGLDAVVAYLQRPDVLASTGGLLLNPDAFVTASTPANDPDLVAYATFARQHLPPLASLSLYASPANWAGATRPALTALVSWPLGWTDVPAYRRRRLGEAKGVLARLGFGGDDEWGLGGGGGELDEEEGEERRGLLRLPGGLGSGTRTQAQVQGSSVTALLRREPEVGRRGRLEALARETLDVLEGLRDEKARQRQEERGGTDDDASSGLLYGATPDRPTSLDCLAFGHLALMLLPGAPDLLPRPWLPRLMRREYSELCGFVDGMLARVERALAADANGGAGTSVAPTSTTAAGGTEQMAEMSVDDAAARADTAGGAGTSVQLRRAWTVGLRFSDGLLRLLPGGLGSEWKRWRRVRRNQHRLGHSGIGWQRGDWLLALGGVMAGGLVATAAVLYRSLTPFGEPVHVFARRRAGDDGGVDLGEIGSMLESWNDAFPTGHVGGGGAMEIEAGARAGVQEIDEASAVLSIDTDEILEGTRR